MGLALRTALFAIGVLAYDLLSNLGLALTLTAVAAGVFAHDLLSDSNPATRRPHGENANQNHVDRDVPNDNLGDGPFVQVGFLAEKMVARVPTPQLNVLITGPKNSLTVSCDISEHAEPLSRSISRFRVTNVNKNQVGLEDSTEVEVGFFANKMVVRVQTSQLNVQVTGPNNSLTVSCDILKQSIHKVEAPSFLMSSNNLAESANQMNGSHREGNEKADAEGIIGSVPGNLSPEGQQKGTAACAVIRFVQEQVAAGTTAVTKNVPFHIEQREIAADGTLPFGLDVVKPVTDDSTMAGEFV